LELIQSLNVKTAQDFVITIKLGFNGYNYYQKLCLIILFDWYAIDHERPQTFFQGEAKIFQGGGQEHTFCSKNILAGQGGKSPPCPPPSGRPCYSQKFRQ
jgi:hypothetical protein